MLPAVGVAGRGGPRHGHLPAAGHRQAVGRPRPPRPGQRGLSVAGGGLGAAGRVQHGGLVRLDVHPALDVDAGGRGPGGGGLLVAVGPGDAQGRDPAAAAALGLELDGVHLVHQGPRGGKGALPAGGELGPLRLPGDPLHLPPAPAGHGRRAGGDSKGGLHPRGTLGAGPPLGLHAGGRLLRGLSPAGVGLGGDVGLCGRRPDGHPPAEGSRGGLRGRRSPRGPLHAGGRGGGSSRDSRKSKLRQCRLLKGCGEWGCRAEDMGLSHRLAGGQRAGAAEATGSSGHTVDTRISGGSVRVILDAAPAPPRSASGHLSAAGRVLEAEAEGGTGLGG